MKTVYCFMYQLETLIWTDMPTYVPRPGERMELEGPGLLIVDEIYTKITKNKSGLTQTVMIYLEKPS